MHRFSAIAFDRQRASRASMLVATAIAVCAAAVSSAQPRSETRETAAVRAASGTTAQRIVLLLPSEQATLRRAALAVRDGVRAVAAKAGATIELRDCAYATDVAAAYQRCVNDDIDAVIGPLGRSEVAALVAAHAKLTFAKPTVMLSPTGATPPKDFYVLAPDLESEADAIAKQSLEDACRKPMLIEMPGQIYSRVAVAILGYYKGGGVSTPLLQQELGARELWQRRADGWRREGIDCVLFAGSGNMIYELRPYLRNITIYITSTSYEAELDRTVDWTGVRIADSPLLLDAQRIDFASVAPNDTIPPTLARLFALGVDAARIAFTAFGADEPPRDATALARSGDEARKDKAFRPAERVDGAIGKLQLRDGQYLRTPAIGEFRGRIPSIIGF
jgi:uncharacterized protein